MLQNSTRLHCLKVARKDMQGAKGPVRSGPNLVRKPCCVLFLFNGSGVCVKYDQQEAWIHDSTFLS